MTACPRRFLSAPFRYRLYFPSHLAACVRDLLGIPPGAEGPAGSLEEVLSWLCRAQDAAGGGVSAGYYFNRGWLAAYPETTGYIIPTFFEYHRITGRTVYRERAVRMADWLLGCQLTGGAFPGGLNGDKPRPRVFNTGQVLQGLNSAFRETGEEKYLASARAAGDWLAGIQSEDGSWNRFSYSGIPHAYHTRVAWPLIELAEIAGEEKYRAAGSRNLEWALVRQRDDGWFSENAFDADSPPLLHTIVYAVEGLLESACLAREPTWLESAARAAGRLERIFTAAGRLSGAYGENWQPAAGWRCLTGEAQMASVWLRLYRVGGDESYRAAGERAIAGLEDLQDKASGNPAIRGGVKGSHPVWGNYQRLAYPNWAAKFFADALLRRASLREETEERD